MTAKQQAEEVIRALPDDASMEQIQYHLYVAQKIRNRLETADAQPPIPQEEVKKRLDTWIMKEGGIPRRTNELRAIAESIAIDSETYARSEVRASSPLSMTCNASRSWDGVFRNGTTKRSANGSSATTVSSTGSGTVRLS